MNKHKLAELISVNCNAIKGGQEEKFSYLISLIEEQLEDLGLNFVLLPKYGVLFTNISGLPLNLVSTYGRKNDKSYMRFMILVTNEEKDAIEDRLRNEEEIEEGEKVIEIRSLISVLSEAAMITQLDNLLEIN